MKAIVFDKNLSPEKFVLREVEKPTPAEGQVLVKIMAASINAADYRSIRLGNIPKSGIFGADIAGKVEAVGAGVSRLKVGDEVFGDIMSAGWGGLAEYVAVPEKLLAIKPAAVSFLDAASLPIACLTALQGLRDLGGIKAGHRVLIHGAGGGVGTFAVQLAKYFGAEVTAVCGPHNVEQSKTLGADRVIDYTKEDFRSSTQPFGLIFAVNGTYPLSDYLRKILPGGRLVVAGGALSQVFSAMLFGPLLSIGGKKTRVLVAKPNQKDLDFIISLVEQGKVKPAVEKIIDLKESGEALGYLNKGHARGKILVRIAE